MREISRNEWKNMINDEIKKSMNRRIKECKKTKSRFLISWEKKQYITKLNPTEAKLILETRLNMLPIGDNFKGINGPSKCGKCNGNETLKTEHIFECNGGENINNITIADLMRTDKTEKLKLVYNHVKKFLET